MDRTALQAMRYYAIVTMNVEKATKHLCMPTASFPGDGAQF
jgi:hypothetical protein